MFYCGDRPWWPRIRWPEELVRRLKADADEAFRGGGADADGAARQLGSDRLVFPAAHSAALSEQALHPRLIGAVSQLLEVEALELRLTQAEVWEKDEAAQRGNFDQRIHCDFPNHTLAVPPRDRPEAVALLVYWDAVEDCGGPTVNHWRAGALDLRALDLDVVARSFCAGLSGAPQQQTQTQA